MSIKPLLTIMALFLTFTAGASEMCEKPVWIEDMITGEDIQVCQKDLQAEPLGMSLMSEHEMKWSDPLSHEGRLYRTDLNTARSLCEDQGLELPTKNDFLLLYDFENNVFFSPAEHVMPISTGYWTSSQSDGDPELYMLQNGHTFSFYFSWSSEKALVTCVERES